MKPGPVIVYAALVALLGSFAASASAAQFTLVQASTDQFGLPHDIVLSPDGSRLYVADNSNHRIAVLDPVTLQLLGEFGRGEIGEPHDVDFDAQGRLLVADTRNHRIAVYAVTGNSGRLVASISGKIRRPEGVAAHPDGRVFATGAASGNLVVYRDGKVIAEADGFSGPHDVAIDAQGGIWVADAHNHRVVQLDAQLETQHEYAKQDYGFNGPRYLDFDSDGNLYVADKYSHNIKVIAPTGQLLQVIGKAHSGMGDGVFNQPEGVEIRHGDFWFADTYNNRIVRYTRTP